MQFQRIDTFIIIYLNEAYCSVRIIVHLKCQNINPMRRGCSTHCMSEMTCSAQFNHQPRKPVLMVREKIQTLQTLIVLHSEDILLRRTNLPIDNKFNLSLPISLQEITNTDCCLHLRMIDKTLFVPNRSCRCFRRYLEKLTHNQEKTCDLKES